MVEGQKIVPFHRRQFFTDKAGHLADSIRRIDEPRNEGGTNP